MELLRLKHRTGRMILTSAAVLGGGLAAIGSLAASSVSATTASGMTITSTGLQAGAIKHVWLIILENKSYDETFSGLNQNSYLWNTLPSQGALLTNYYGTGHFSMDNYISMVSGQGPSEDVQDDCSTNADMTGPNSNIITTGAASQSLGQQLVHGGVDAPVGSNGCVFPTNVATLFNQFNAAGISWKGYAQDLGGAQPVGSPTYVTSSDGVTDTVPGRDDGTCGYPGTSSANPVTNPTALTTAGAEANPDHDVSTYTGAQPADANSGLSGTTPNGDPADQFVAKHFPFPWFTALTGQSEGNQNTTAYAATPALNEPSSDLRGEGSGFASNCDPSHIANLDDPNYGLVHDLKSESTTPAFSWITPDNCSDAHDATCQGNNLSGAFDPSGHPVFTPAGLPAYDPEATTPTNYTGGLYASDLFLQYYIPLIEASPAFNDGGLIDITFDEANPPFTVGNSFNNAKAPGDSGTFAPADQPTYGAPGTTAPGANSLYGAYGILTDAAGENIQGHNLGSEPTGPNDPEMIDASGDQLAPGPGDDGFIDRPPNCTSPGVPAGCVAGQDLASGPSSPGMTKEQGTYTAGSSTIVDPKINANDTGRLVSGPGIPPGSFVGAVTDTGPVFLSANASTTNAANNDAKPWNGSFQVVDDNGDPVTLTMSETASGTTNNITLGAEGATWTTGTGACPSATAQATTASCQTLDPLVDATDFTPGGGDTGSVLISPLITPGTVSSVYYNHYSWLATMEDLFDVSAGDDNSALSPGAGSVSGGLDGLGHLGYAAQPGLRPFGLDIFDNGRCGASFEGCNLQGAILTGDELAGDDFQGAKLQKADLSGADLQGADLSGADLQGADLSDADLQGADLSDANLQKADLSGADLQGADLSGAHLQGVQWSDTTCPDGTNSDSDGGTCTGHT